MSTKLHDITPHISLMPKLGQSGYSAPQAIAELVDNSIDARIEGDLLSVNIKIDRNVISISDNGLGMNEKQLVKALTLGHSEKKNKLGEFGLGLKTACTSLGGYFEVITSPEGNGQEYKIIYNQEDWLMKKNWDIPVNSAKTDKNAHFTIIKITKLYTHRPQLAEILKKDLERRFAPYIKRGDVSIKINGKECKPGSPNLIEDSKKEFKVEIKEYPCKGKKIYGWYGLLKEGSQKGLYGFSTYRRGRMITTYDKIAIGEHPTISRIIGEIYLDFVPVSHNKKEFIKESNEYILIEKYLKEEFKDLIKQARSKAVQDKITKNVINEIEIWKEKISEAIIRSPEFKYYTSPIDQKTGMIVDESEQEKEALLEKREKSGDNTGTVESKDTDIKRIPKKVHEDKKKIIRVKGKSFEFEHKFASLGQDSAWKEYDFDRKKKKIVIFTNTDFPAYSATKDTIFYAVLHIAEAIAEIMVKEAGEEVGNMQEIKEAILKVASNLKMQIE